MTTFDYKWRHSDVTIWYCRLQLLLLITHDRIKISGNKKHHCVRLIHAHLMICGTTPVVTFGSHRGSLWPWPEVKNQIDLLRSNDIPIDSSRREEHDGANPVPVSCLGKRLWASKSWPKIWPFLTWEVNGWPLTQKSYTNSEISSCPTRSFLSRGASSIRGQTRGGGSHRPPWSVRVWENA